MTAEVFALKAGWFGMLFGVLSGAVLGLFFHRKEWLGGYASHPRRFLRLGHISFFGIGLLNLFYGLSLKPFGIDGTTAWWGAIGLSVALVTMPMCCFLTAWKKGYRHLFPLPVIGAATGIIVVLGSDFWMP